MMAHFSTHAARGHAWPQSLRRHEHGFGLIEVLIAMTLGLLLLGGVGYLFMGSKRMSVAQLDAVRMNESVRNASDVMGRALRHANYKLDINFKLKESPIEGTDGGGVAADAKSDVLVVRHDPNRVVPPPDTVDPLQGSEVNCEGATITSSNEINPDNGAAGRNINLVVYQFRVVDNKLMCYANTNYDSVPTTGGVVVAENIENMQVKYAIGTGKEAIDKYIDQPSAADFLKVSAVRVTLVVRGPSKNVVVGGVQKLAFNGGELAIADGHLRSVVTTTFMVRNQTKFNPDDL